MKTSKKPAENGDSESITRRAVLKHFSALRLGWAAFVASSGVATLATIRFFFPNVLFEPPTSLTVGYPSEYGEVGTVYTQWKQRGRFWLIREAGGIFALSTVCTHLGCTPNWLAMEAKFKCPCHGSGFHRNGINFEGPAPRPLERFRIFLAEDGQIVVDKSKKYQQEKGQWTDPEAYLRI